MTPAQYLLRDCPYDPDADGWGDLYKPSLVETSIPIRPEA
jgi:hypothetical protein